MHRLQTTLATAVAFRPLAVLLFAAAQVIGAGRCAACDPGECAACVAGGVSDTATAAATCPLCTVAAAGGCHANEGGTAATDRDAPPCRCQWEPRDHQPGLPLTRSVVDLAQAGSWPASSPEVPRTTALGARPAALSDIPQRPVRILLGVWRN